MEDALVPVTPVTENEFESVLILVLMEDALVRWQVACEKFTRVCLNPCFNGRCTRTRCSCCRIRLSCIVLILVLMEDALVPGLKVLNLLDERVLILVLMEDALVLYLAANYTQEFEWVLILVLMEDALVLGSRKR